MIKSFESIGSKVLRDIMGPRDQANTNKLSSLSDVFWFSGGVNPMPKLNFTNHPRYVSSSNKCWKHLESTNRFDQYTKPPYLEPDPMSILKLEIHWPPVDDVCCSVRA